MRVPDYVRGSTALISGCGLYRYTLKRHWRGGRGVCVFVMLNPSKATAYQDDPTVRRCTEFARKWGFEALTVLNLFAFRATDPKEMKAAEDPIGPHNDETIVEVCTCADRVIAAWGRDGAHLGRATAVVDLLRAECGLVPEALRLTQEGFPTHPLARGKHWVPYDVEPVPLYVPEKEDDAA